MDDSPSVVIAFDRGETLMTPINFREKMEADVFDNYPNGPNFILVRDAVYEIVSRRVVRFQVIVRRGIAHETGIN